MRVCANTREGIGERLGAQIPNTEATRLHNFTYNAQQQPQSLWSRMWDVRLEHAGHCVRTSKLAGAVQPTGIGAGLPSTANAGLGLSTHVPIIFCTWATVMPSKRSLRPAVQPGDCGFN